VEINSDFALCAENICKSYGEGEAKVEVVKSITIGFNRGKITTIIGPSGSGKSTLLNLLGGLDTVDSGTITCGDIEVSKLKPKELVQYRRRKLGFVFQMYNLIPNLTVRENIQVCEYLSKQSLDIDHLIEVLGLKEHESKFPSQLSGGQQQRCAIGRALVKNPEVLFCDEPTGALDYKTSKNVLMLMEKINQEFGTTMLIVTHNIVIKDMSHRVIKIKDGEVVSNICNYNLVSAADLEW
jgi:putative ABC transport system ATP-binding protein